MIIIPAIDLKDGACVRLIQGDMQRDTVYSHDPAAMAKRWLDEGAERLHVVDLNGAFAGHPVNEASVRAIVTAVAGIPVQLGGGIRDLATMERYFALGIAKVILGTIACRDPELVKAACRLHPGRIIVGIDARDGWAAVAGWAEMTDLAAVDLAKRFEDVGVAEIIYTDISRDGLLAGPNVAATRCLAEGIAIPVIASGGVSGLGDIQNLVADAGPYANGNRIIGVITGKALYDGRLEFGQAVALARG